MESEHNRMDMSYPDYGLNYLNYFQTLYTFGQQFFMGSSENIAKRYNTQEDL